MPKRGSCGSLLQGCRLSKQNPSVALTIESSARIKSSYRSVLSRCPTSRDFVPWRFLDAGQLSARIFHCCRRPKTSTEHEVAARQPAAREQELPASKNQ